MHKIIISLAIATLCGTQATAGDAISINTQARGSSKIPVVFEFQGKTASETVLMLNQTKIFDAKFGSCRALSDDLGQDVICISANGSSSAKIEVPNVIDRDVGYVESSTQLASDIYKLSLSESESPFTVDLALVTKDKSSGLYSLAVTDYKGQSSKVLLESPMPILSPSWSPNGKYLAYVSYETYRTSIFVQNVESGVRLKVYEVRGLNAFPSFKDNETLLMSVSGEKRNSNIAEFNLLTKQLTPVVASAKHSDVYPKATKSGSVFVRMFKDIPYLYGLADGGKVYQLSKSPNNLPSSTADGTVLASSFGGYIYIWDMLNKKVADKINTRDRVESLSISAGGQSYYYVTDSERGYSLVSYTAYGTKLFALTSKTADIIQVSAK